MASGSFYVATVATITRVASANTDTLILAANNTRKGMYLFNESTAVLVLSLGVASGAIGTGPYTVQVGAGAFFELPWPSFIGAIRGQWSAVNGAAQVTELT